MRFIAPLHSRSDLSRKISLGKIIFFCYSIIVLKKKEFVEKNIRLSFEFSKYLIDHPEFEEKIPAGAEVVILLEDDHKFNKKAEALAEKSKQEGQQVVFVKVKALAPVSASRLINPRLELAEWC